jgi:hypothetical protein
VIDDATLIADRTVTYLAAKYGRTYDLWGALFSQTVALRDELRRQGCFCVFTAHIVPAEMKSGVRLKGGPAFPGQTRSKLPAAAELLLRAEPREGFGWKYSYRTASPHPDWLQGSRYNTPDPAPMNLREILLHAGFSVPRLRGLEWMDGFADGLAEALQGHLGDAKYMVGLFDQGREQALKEGIPKQHALWAIRDGFDRAVLQATPPRTESLYGLPAVAVHSK